MHNSSREEPTAASAASLSSSHADHASSSAPTREARERAVTPPSPFTRQQQSSISLPSYAHTRSTQIFGLDATVESPLDDGDVRGELIGGSYASAGSSLGTYFRRQPGFSSSSLTLFIPDERMSLNPAYEAAGSLNSRGSMSHMSNATTGMDMDSSMTLARAAADSDLEEDLILEQDRQGHAGTMDGSLPEDDGMASLREKLHEIRILAVSVEEKAKRMHDLMTQQYLAHRADIQPVQTEDSAPELSADPALSMFAPPIDPRNPYNLRPSDLEPSFSPLTIRPRDSDADNDETMEEEPPAILGCKHYKRNVKVQCFDCHLWFVCRHCHDQSPELSFSHQLNRKKTQNMLCMICHTPQPAGEVCECCSEYAAWYYCAKCKLWDNDNNKRIYHCDDCGICRVGEGLGKDYVHCRRCNVCISISTSSSHPCIERATEGDCPLCLVRLFESPTPVVSLPCGHYMHGECYRDLMAVTYKCPVCSKSAVNMELQWRKLTDEILAQPMPDEDDDIDGLWPPPASHGAVAGDVTPPNNTQTRRPREVYIGCNDCSRRSWTPFHWLGLKCQICDSYNTNQMQPTAVKESDAERIIRQQQHQHRQHDFTGHAVLRDAGIGADEQVVPVETTLEVPTSPSQHTEDLDQQRAAADAQSPSRRYFVQVEEERQPSFTAPRFSTPSIPTIPSLYEMPRLPRMPHLPNMPNMPNMPDMGLPRFLPYEMLDAVSRRMSPMRYYLQGLDMRDDSDSLRLTRARDRSSISVRSDPTADASEGKMRGDAHVWGSSEDGEGNASGESVGAVGSESSETSEDGSDDAEMEEGEDENEDDGEVFELFGHR